MKTPLSPGLVEFLVERKLKNNFFSILKSSEFCFFFSSSGCVLCCAFLTRANRGETIIKKRLISNDSVRESHRNECTGQHERTREGNARVRLPFEFLE